MIERDDVLVTLECKHTLRFARQYSPPKVGEWVWCPRCQTETLVESTPVEWRIRCISCKFSRPFGTSEANAVRAASAHSSKLGHRVQVKLGRKVKQVVGEIDPVLSVALEALFIEYQNRYQKRQGSSIQTIDTNLL